MLAHIEITDLPQIKYLDLAQRRADEDALADDALHAESLSNLGKAKLTRDIAEARGVVWEDERYRPITPV